jgi:hypothetical protein
MLLLGLVVDAIHQLEANNPMLSFIQLLLSKMKHQLRQLFTLKPELNTCQFAADKRTHNPTSAAISFDLLLEQDAPAMDAATHLDSAVL